MPALGLPDDELFQACNIVLPCWVLLMLMPGHKLTKALCQVSALALCALYAALILPVFFPATGPGFDFRQFTSLAGVAKMFATPASVLPGWVHFSVADLWVGKWIAEDAAQRHMSRLIMAPILFAAMMLGPTGLGAYFLVRYAFLASQKKRR